MPTVRALATACLVVLLPLVMLAPAGAAQAQEPAPSTQDTSPEGTPPPGDQASTPAGEQLPSTMTGEQPPSTTPGGPTTPDKVFSGTPVPEAAKDELEEHAWFDQGHAYFGRLFFTPVFTLDRFFSDQTELEPERSRSYARLRSALRLRQDGKPTEAVDFYADLHLPGLNRWLDRFRLVLVSAADSTLSGFNSETNTTAPSSSRVAGPANAELRFGAYNGIRSSVDTGAGIFFRIPLGAFVRARFRTAIPVRDLFVTRIAVQSFWRTDLHLGVRADVALERPLGTSTLVRLANTSQVAQRRTNGVEYGTELVWSHAFSPTIALALGTDAQGATGSRMTLDKYRVFGRLRHDVLRRWLFVELEPEVGWPWTRERGRYRALAAIIRLEIQFSAEGSVPSDLREGQ